MKTPTLLAALTLALVLLLAAALPATFPTPMTVLDTTSMPNAPLVAHTYNTLYQS